MKRENEGEELGIHVALWMHCNELLWGRFSTLFQLQAAAFAFQVVPGATYQLKAALSIAIGFLTLLLLVVIQADLTIRNRRRDLIKSKFAGFDPTDIGESIAAPDRRKSERLIYRLVFICLALVDFGFALFPNLFAIKSAS